MVKQYGKILNIGWLFKILAFCKQIKLPAIYTLYYANPNVTDARSGNILLKSCRSAITYYLDGCSSERIKMPLDDVLDWPTNEKTKKERLL